MTLNASDRIAQFSLRTDDGQFVTFVATGDAIAPIAEEVARGRAFQEDTIIVAEPMAAHVLPGKRLVRIDAAGDLPPALLPQLEDGNAPGETQIREIRPEDYDAGSRDLKERHAERASMLQEGRPIQVFGRIGLAGDVVVYLRFDLPVPNIPEQRRFLVRLLSMPHIAFRNLDGGYGSLNPGRIVHATFVPGAEPPSHAWHAKEVG